MDAMRWIYLSPHLDDAALSVGGLIYDQTQSGIPVEIWTFMCSDPGLNEVSSFAQLQHAQWGFANAVEAMRERRKEDLRAADILGAKAVHFDFLDCIYRRGKGGEWLYYDIFVPPHEEDADLPREIASTITPRLQPDDMLVCQLSVGSHVDHVLVRQAAELLGLRQRLIYDIDMPYFLYKSDEFEAKMAGMKESVHRITEAGLERWLDAVAAYKSQLPALHELVSTPEKAHASIRAYWEKWGGIRLLQNR
jgi:LmbE family N-acetylglucosaminyl deacetylase